MGLLVINIGKIRGDMGNTFIGLETWGGCLMGRSTSLAGLKGGEGGRGGVIQCWICYGSVAMEEGGGL